MSSPAARMVYVFAQTSAGSTEFTANYSAAATVSATWAWIKPTSTEVYLLERVVIHIEDAGPLNADNYGGLASSLPNGIHMYVQASGGSAGGSTVLDLTPVPVKSNAQWGKYCYDVDLDAFGAGNDFVNIRWTFAKSGSPIVLEAGHRLGISLMDDLSGLAAHSFNFQGFWQPQTIYKG